MFFTPIGERFECEFEQGNAHGFGMIYSPNGDLYIGYIRDFKKSGHGRMIYKSNGLIFEGEWADNMREGLGYLLYPDGRLYCGQFKKDQEDGVGEYMKQGTLKWGLDIGRKREIEEFLLIGCRQIGYDYKKRNEVKVKKEEL